jgi:hypothetical protein
VPTITSISVELMERLRRQKVAKEQAAAAEKRREEAQRAAAAAEVEWRRLQQDSEQLEREEAARHGAARAPRCLTPHDRTEHSEPVVVRQMRAAALCVMDRWLAQADGDR